MKCSPDKKIVIAVDGFSSCGKSTFAKKIASALGYVFIDTGAMYRAVTLYALDNGIIDSAGNIDKAALTAALDDIVIDFMIMPDGSQHTTLNGVDVEADIRTLRVSSVVSPVSAIAAVRRRLTAMQQALGAERGIVMDGRDIGTTVFPDAELKIFLDASAQTRAQRRFKELQDKGSAVSYADVLANVVHRDEIDRTRAESPLRRADDAIAIDNSAMDIATQDAWLLDRFNETIAKLSAR